MQHMKNFTIGLPACAFLVFLSTYSMMARTNCTTATMNDPSAIDPMWYRTVRPIALRMGPRGMSSLCQ